MNRRGFFIEAVRVAETWLLTIIPQLTTGDRTAAHRKSDRHRDDPCAGGLHNRAWNRSVGNWYCGPWASSDWRGFSFIGKECGMMCLQVIVTLLGQPKLNLHQCQNQEEHRGGSYINRVPYS